MDTSKALIRAVNACGSQAALADKIGVKQQVISFWLNKASSGVAAEYVLAIERASGVSRHDLRPDLYPKDGGYQNG